MATRWYTTIESVKAALPLGGADLDALIGSYIEAASAKVESELHRVFIPTTATKYFPWPQYHGEWSTLDLKEDLIAITELKTRAQDTSPITIAAADYFVEPVNDGPPFDRIEIDTSSSSAFEAGNTSQRAISVAGRWGYGEDTKAAGALAEADDGAELALDVTDSSLVGVGDTILLGSEALFVSDKALLDTTANTAGVLAASQAETTVPVNTGTLIHKGEVISIDSERMLVESISLNNLTVKRAYDGSVLATHDSPSDIYAPRTLTVVRAVNGTTAAAHNSADAIRKYAPPADITDLCRAEAIARHEQGRSGWTGQIGGGDSAVETHMFNLYAMWRDAKRKYRRTAVA